MKKSDVLQAVKFALVGLVNTALDYGLFFVFFSLCSLDKNLAQVLATALAMTNSYLVNRYWTFQKSGGVRGGEIWRFILVNLLSLLTTLLCLNLFYDLLSLHTLANRLLALIGLSFRLSGDSAVMFCKLLAVPFSLAVNFLGNRLWVFKNKSAGREDSK
ncbi:MAG: GtrA family protein [Clostridia bacterium]